MKKTIILMVFALGAAAWCGAGSVPEKASAAPANVQPVLASYNEGLSLLRTGKRMEALAAFNRAMAAGAGLSEPDARALVSSAAHSAGGIMMLEGKPAEAEGFYIKAVAANPRHALALNDLGLACLKQGRLDDALAQFGAATKADPRLSLSYQNLAECLMAEGNLRGASEYLARGIQADPVDQRALVLLAAVYEREGNREKQEQVWKSLLEKTGGSPRAKLQLGSFYMQSGSYDKARELFQEIMAANPKLLDARLQILRLDAVQGKRAAAEEGYRALLAEFPGETGVRCELAGLMIQQGRIDEAEALAGEGTRLVPDAAGNWYVLGRCQEKRGRFAAAKKSYLQAVTCDLHQADAWTSLGLLANRRQDDAEALRCFTAAFFADPFSTEIRYHLGRMMVVTKPDHGKGLSLLKAAGRGTGLAAERARHFVAAHEKASASGGSGATKP